MRDVQPLDFEKLKSKLRKTETKFGRPMSPATVNRYLFTGSKIFSLGVVNGIVDSNPVLHVEKLTEPPPRDSWLSGEEEDALLPKLLKDGEAMRAFGELPLHVGFRAGELLSRRWLHVNLGEAIGGHRRDQDGAAAQGSSEHPRPSDPQVAQAGGGGRGSDLRPAANGQTQATTALPLQGGLRTRRTLGLPLPRSQAHFRHPAPGGGSPRV